jgi:hypothetical protein
MGQQSAFMPMIMRPDGQAFLSVPSRRRPPFACVANATTATTAVPEPPLIDHKKGRNLALMISKAYPVEKSLDEQDPVHLDEQGEVRP